MRNNPWINMKTNSQRRINAEIEHDIFWFVDITGKYGFILKSKAEFNNVDKNIRLKNIEAIKQNNEAGNGELYLILDDKEEWEIFHVLCCDLINLSIDISDENMLIVKVENRIKRWQVLLRLDRNRVFTPEIERGLYAELKCLKDIMIPQNGIVEGIKSWVGPEFDKQDFVTKDRIIEVKSYQVSKGKKVKISSVDQLDVKNNKLALITYGLIKSEYGETVEYIASQIKRLAENESIQLMDLFECKLLDYGFIKELIKEPLTTYVVSENSIYDIRDEFPRIKRDMIEDGINDIKYSLDLEKCSRFEIELVELFGGK